MVKQRESCKKKVCLDNFLSLFFLTLLILQGEVAVHTVITSGSQRVKQAGSLKTCLYCTVFAYSCMQLLLLVLLALQCM